MIRIKKKIRDSGLYAYLKVTKYVLWEAWVGGVVRVADDRYLVTDGVFKTETEYLKRNFLTPYAPFRIMNKEAVESWKKEGYSIAKKNEEMSID